MADDREAKARLVRPVDLTDDEAKTKAIAASKIAIGLIGMADLYGRAVVGTACMTAATVLILGRPLRTDDEEITKISEEFVDKILAQRDVLREDATNMQDMPTKVM